MPKNIIERVVKTYEELNLFQELLVTQGLSQIISKSNNDDV